MRDHAEEFGGDPKRIFPMSHGAGAHLASLTATDERPLQSVGMKRSELAGVILLDGAGYGVPQQVREARLPALRKLYLDAFGEDWKVQKDASPIAHVDEERGGAPGRSVGDGRCDGVEGGQSVRGPAHQLNGRSPPPADGSTANFAMSPGPLRSTTAATRAETFEPGSPSWHVPSSVARCPADDHPIAAIPSGSRRLRRALRRA